MKFTPSINTTDVEGVLSGAPSRLWLSKIIWTLFRFLLLYDYLSGRL